MVSTSYNKEELDAEKVLRFASYLSRKELKMYIRALKEQEKSRTVVVDSSFESKGKAANAVQSLFPHKKIVYRVDPSLLLVFV